MKIIVTRPYVVEEKINAGHEVATIRTPGFLEGRGRLLYLKKNFLYNYLFIYFYIFPRKITRHRGKSRSQQLSKVALRLPPIDPEVMPVLGGRCDLETFSHGVRGPTFLLSV